jgi:methionyl-tRNA synthetase
VVNLASRSAKFVKDVGLSQEYPDDGGLFDKAARAGDSIAQAYENCDYNRAMRLIMALADDANPFVEQAEPWNLKKDPAKADQLQDVCTVAINLFRQLVIYLTPVLPELTDKTAVLLGHPITHWDQSQTPLLGTKVAKFKHMMQRVDQKDIDKMVDDTREEQAQELADGVRQNAQNQFNDSPDALAAEPLADECTIDDFVKVDLRVARVIEAEHVPDARKLLKLTLSLGGEETRTVFAGIKAAYDPEKLVGRLVVMVANLKPRQMKFGLSEGMVCASGTGGAEVFLLSPDEGAIPGQRVH